LLAKFRFRRLQSYAKLSFPASFSADNFPVRAMAELPAAAVRRKWRIAHKLAKVLFALVLEKTEKEGHHFAKRRASFSKTMPFLLQNERLPFLHFPKRIENQAVAKFTL